MMWDLPEPKVFNTEIWGPVTVSIKQDCEGLRMAFTWQSSKEFSSTISNERNWSIGPFGSAEKELLLMKFEETDQDTVEEVMPMIEEQTERTVSEFAAAMEVPSE